ncbi:hypothetical protein F4679DRAFT_564148 [Xylaria curta]|nr:hypothetical protein F4679DRAFT_564148 [Xylaria curta]
MESAAEKTATPVLSAATKCLDLFASALQAARLALDAITRTHLDISAPDYRLLTVERDRFRIWAANAAAFAEGRSSLDYRLRQLPEELDLVKSLVNAVCSQLQSYISAIMKAEGTLAVERLASDADLKAPGKGSIPSPVGTGDKADAVLTAPKPEIFNYANALESIHISIDWLHRLSNLLRKASVVNQNLHAQSYKIPNVEFDGLGAFFAWVVARDFPGLSEQLKSRMVRTMVERYRRILYRRGRYGSGWRQQGDYEHKDQPATLEKAAETELSSKDYQSSASGTNKQQELAEHLSIEKNTTLFSETAETEPDRSRYHAPSIVSTARSAALNHDAEMLLPPPPKQCRTEASFTCDFCCMILSSKTGSSRVLWSKHLKQDLDSYVCLFDRCDQPYSLFSSSKEWLHHMRSEHLIKWICPVEDDNVVEFGSQEGLVQHMNQFHPDIFSPEMLPSIIEACRETAEVVFKACPFCNKTPKNNIEEHVGHHLRYLALKSIPWQDDDGEDKGHDVEEKESLAQSDNTIRRGTLGHSIGSLKTGSLHLGDERGSVASEYGGKVFLASEEQKQSPRPEWAKTSSDQDDRQAEWGFIEEIMLQHEQWRVNLNAEAPKLPLPATMSQAASKSPGIRDWLRAMDTLNLILKPESGIPSDHFYPNYQPVRIAVLDTGISPQAIQFIQENGGGVEVKNFMPGDKEVTYGDDHGHGSLVAMTIAKVAPRAALYISRVTDGDFSVDGLEQGAARIQNAIEWCIDLQVDLVVISVTFARREERIEQAINRAAKRGIVFFSPSGDRGNRMEAFPASMPEVIRVFSTDANTTPVVYDPPPSINNTKFAFLGENILEPYPGVSYEGSHGTTIAAAVATGVTGTLLDFLRQPICRKLIGGGGVKKEDIMSIFSTMSVSCDGYDCVDPSRLLHRMKLVSDARSNYRIELSIALSAIIISQRDSVPHQFSGTLDTVSSNLMSELKYNKSDESAYHETIATYKKEFGPDDLLTLHVVNSLGQYYLKLGRYRDAEAVLLRAAEGFHRRLGADNKVTIGVRNAFAKICQAQGRFKEAETIFEEVLKSSKTVLGPDHLSTIGVVSNIAQIYQAQGQLEKAETFFQTVFQSSTKLLGPKHLLTIGAMNDIAQVYQAQGRLEEAVPLFQQALELSKEVLGLNHLSTVRVMIDIAKVYQAQGRLKNAVSLFEQALETFKKSLGPEHLSTISVMNNIAQVYQAQGRLEEAETLFEEVVKSFTTVLGPGHQSTIDVIHNLYDVRYQIHSLQYPET